MSLINIYLILQHYNYKSFDLTTKMNFARLEIIKDRLDSFNKIA